MRVCLSALYPLIPRVQPPPPPPHRLVPDHALLVLSLLPAVCIRTVPQVYWPTIQFSFNKYRGYLFCSQFFGYEVYRHPALSRVQYMLRLDDDINVPPNGSHFDIFEDMHTRGKRVGWVQWSRDHLPSRKMSGLYPLSRQFACRTAVRQFPLATTYNMTSRIENLNAGCAEAYHVDVFMNDHYMRFLMWIQMWHGMTRFYLEQVQPAAPLSQWCPQGLSWQRLPGVTDSSQSTDSSSLTSGSWSLVDNRSPLDRTLKNRQLAEGKAHST